MLSTSDQCPTGAVKVTVDYPGYIASDALSAEGERYVQALLACIPRAKDFAAADLLDMYAELAPCRKLRADALAAAQEAGDVWCGRDAVRDEQRDEIFSRRVTIFSYAFTGPDAHDDLQGAVSTMEEHHPGHTVWVEQIPTD